MSQTNNTKQAFWIALGSLFSFGFGIVSSMILSRYFDKADYGTYKQVIYVYHTLLTVFTLGLPKAFSYFLPRVEINQAKNLIKKITNLFFILGAVFSVILFVFAPQISIILKNPDLKIALRIFSLVPFLMLPTMGLEGILSTYRKTKFMAIYTIITRVIMLLCVALPVIIFNLGYQEALIGFTIASFISFIIALYFKYMPVKNTGNDKCSITYKEIFKFSVPLLYASLWGVLIASADQFFISRYFGNEVFAEFSNGSIELPFVGMIVGATSTVLSPIFSRMSHERLDPHIEFLPIWKSVFEKSAMLIYPLVIYSIFFANIIMVALYGQQYENSGIYFRLKLIINFFNIIVFAPLIINIGKVKFYANVHMYTAIILIVLEFLSVSFINSPYVLILISTLCNIGKIIIMLLFVSKYLKVKSYELFPINVIFKILIPSIIILSFLYYFLVIIFDINVFLNLIISFALYISLYFFVSLYIKLDYLSIIKPLLKR
ncbi:MAG: oligosaccharide flippase family protein [Bacteroidales bacterium]|nr:oligosaccharide flippase family protein [Bacteroidales bacterium]